MIEYKTGDLFSEDAEALVNSVNCVGVMGRGIALQFKNTFLRTSRSTQQRANAVKSSQGRCSSSRPVS